MTLSVALLHISLSLGSVAAADTLDVLGVVVDSASGEPLPASVVKLVEIFRQDLSHDDGSFHLRRVPAGTYTLVVERLGYRTERQRITVGDDRSAYIRVLMHTSPISVTGLVVTATMGARTLEEALRPTQAVTGRELERQLDVTLAETIAGEAGVSSSSMGPAPARPVIRGLGGDRILILEDGERVGDVSSTSPDHAVSVESVSAERIEIVRGPAALFYGSNALGGVVNVVREEIPVSPSDHPTGAVTVQGQSVNQGGAAAGSYRRSIGPLGVRVEASGRWAGDMRTPLGALPSTGITTYGGAAGAAWIGNSATAGASLRGYRSEYGIPPDSVSGHARGVTVELERDALRAEARLERGGVLNDAQLNVSLTRYDHREIEATGAIGTAFGQNTASTELIAHHQAVGVFHRGGFGTRLQWQEFISDNGRDVVRSDEYGGAVYALEEVDFDPLTVQAGLRYDVQRVVPRTDEPVQGVPVRERTFSQLSGSIATLFDLGRGWRVGASVSRAFRTPSSEELFSQGPHLAAYTFEVGNPELDAETGLGADLFLRVERPGLRGEAAGFWNEISDYSFPSNTGQRLGSFFVYRFVNTDARFYGGEASAEWNVMGDFILAGDLSYVYATNLVDDEPLPLIPPLAGGLELRYDRERFFVEGSWDGAARQDRVPERPELPSGSAPYCDDPSALPATCRPIPGDVLPTDAYGVFGAAAGYRWFPGHQIHSLTLRLENLTDEVYRNHLSRIKELSPEPGFGATLLYRVAF